MFTTGKKVIKVIKAAIDVVEHIKNKKDKK